MQAQCEGWLKAYPGEIIDEPMVRSDGTVSYSIKFDDGEIRSSVEGVCVYPISLRRFNRGDRVEAQCSGWAKAYAGEIIDAPLVRSDGTVAYSIRFDDGEERQNVDDNLVS